MTEKVVFSDKMNKEKKRRKHPGNKRERERDRQTDRQTDRQNQRERDI